MIREFSVFNAAMNEREFRLFTSDLTSYAQHKRTYSRCRAENVG